MKFDYQSCNLKVKNTLLLVFIILTSQPLFSQKSKPAIPFKHFTVAQGLSHNFTKCTFQDSNGIIWVATEGGINKFDGYDFRVFEFDSEDPKSVSHNNILDIDSDSKGDLWFCSWGGGISVMDLKTERFTRILNDSTDKTNLPTNFIYSLYRDSQSRMWACTVAGLALINDSTYQIEKHYKHIPNNPASLKENKIRCVAEGEPGKLWVATIGGGLLSFDIEGEKFEEVGLGKTSSGKEKVYSLLYDDQQRLWVGTWDDGLFLIDKDGVITNFLHDETRDNSLLNNQVWSIGKDANGKIWVGTDSGISIYNEEGNVFFNYPSVPFDPKSLNASAIRDIFLDKENRVWVSTVGGGVNLYDQHFADFKHFYNIPDVNSISYHSVNSIICDTNDNLWIVTDGGGLNYYDRSTDEFLHFSHNSKSGSSIAGNKIKTIFEDSNNNMWLGFWANGIDRYDKKNRKLTHFEHQEGNIKTPNNNNVFDFAEDNKGDIWIATFGGGLNKYDPKSGNFEYIIPEKNKSITLSYSNIRILDYYEGKLYIGQENGFIDILDVETHEVLANIPLKGRQGNNYEPMSMKRDKAGDLWVGTQGGGLWKFDEEILSFSKKFKSEKETYNNYIYSIEIDKNGLFWMGTNNGISTFDPLTGKMTSYGVERGVQGYQFNRQSSHLLNTGELVFGGANGFNIFHPDSIKPYLNYFPVVFSKFELFNKEVTFEKGSPLKTTINTTSSITLNYKQSLFSITYASLNYSSVENVNYAYRLKGFVDESWQYVGNERKATYSNLSPATYEFEVGIVDNDGIGVTNIRNLKIDVLPPWWLTWWFKFISISLLVSVFVGVFLLRVRVLESQKKILEQNVEERTKELWLKNDEIVSQNNELQAQQEELHAQREELSVQNKELNITLDKLKMAQSQLVQSEKMASLGLLTAGIAHEINNPVNFIKSGIAGLHIVIEQFTIISSLYTQVNKDNMLEKLKEINELKESIKFDKIMEKAQLITAHINTGANRTAEIVKGLRTFSRSDTNNFAKFDISEGIDNTLLLLNQLIKNRIEVHKDYQSKIEIECASGQINQVIMNLLTNALQAIGEEGEIFITAYIAKKSFYLKIKDTGRGIPENHLKHVFDPFFTTKTVGEGTGLGLSIVMGIIEQHSGEIKVESTVGEGTAFEVILPVSQHALDV
ncbi:two-component regulator propeller domain-containing protein [Flammeovirgaceae bacterium SG7u.111]|nr:two-component regulator propeller domain-containing protein [Flammeovirgaceae bacterium SG7u.132]WPO36842.1 two-component regulator propeller domain-containing protein [Flammeovirgaceae bacterium SG7u.111]